jgi:hypothetical protein
VAVWMAIGNIEYVRRIAGEHPELAETLRSQGLLPSET